ncbi:MAG: hypothetical protein R3B48_11390 [Kofleriaceae bacterium]
MTDSRGGVSKVERAELHAAEAALADRRWPEAKRSLLRLASLNRAEPRYRAMLALVLGHEAMEAGDPQRARSEWARAAKLDPSLEASELRPRRRSLVKRLFAFL